MLLLPTPVRQTAHGYSPELCKRSRPVPQITTFVFPAFTLNPFSMASFHINSLLTHSSRESAMMRSSAIGPPREHERKLKWQGLQHNDEEQVTEYGSLVDPNLHLKHLAEMKRRMKSYDTYVLYAPQYSMWWMGWGCITVLMHNAM